MTINNPTPAQIPELRRLWQEAFGDPDAFLDAFFSTGYSSRRCRCIEKDGAVAAALYWFDCAFENGKLAYLYAVATDRAQQRQGLCAKLLEDTHCHLKALGYDGVVLVPGSDDLRRYYRRFGYEDFGGIRQMTVSAAALRAVDKQEYACLRRKYLPQGGVVQEGELLDFFATFAKFYAGDGFVLATTGEKAELLGNAPAGKDITVRAPGDTPFAMYLPLTGKKEKPAYFGIALD